MADKLPSVAPETGWGMVFPNTCNLTVQNHAANGRSTKSFRNDGHWSKVYEQRSLGDWVFIQFGHNDQKIADTTRYAAPQTDYRKNLLRYIAEIRSKGANPLLITPVMRRKFDEKETSSISMANTRGLVKEIAKQQNVPLIDLHAKSTEP